MITYETQGKDTFSKVLVREPDTSLEGLNGTADPTHTAQNPKLHCTSCLATPSVETAWGQPGEDVRA